MSLRRINSFETAAPDKLADQLSRLEDNIDAALSAIPVKPLWSDWVSSGTPQASYDQILRVDTSVAAAAVGVTLPSVSQDTISRPVGIVRRGTQNITLAPVESTALIDGAATVTLAADALFTYIHDGDTWYRV